jgi:predicted phage tail protein
VAADRATAIAMAVVLSAEVAATQASREAAEVARGGSLREQRRRAARRARVDSMSPVLSLLCALGAFVPLAGWAFIVGAYYFWFRTLRSGTASGCLRHAGAMLAALGVLAQLFWAS